MAFVLSRGASMTFQEAVRSGFENYANFQDRTSRSGYWYWVLFALLAGIAASVVDVVLGTGTATGGVVSALLGLALLVPNIAVAVRRLHDVGKSGWWVLAGLIPVLGWIYLLYLYVQPSQPMSNGWGAPATA